jgi:L-threonylcarbamoyladenylate synthase
MVRVVRASLKELEAAVTALRDGELVAFPTETVYGLGANAQNPAAVRRIFELKDRPVDHPVIVHLDNPKYLHRWAREVPEAAQKLAARFWPGPLTMVLPRSENVHDVVTGGQETVAIRVPSHPMAQQLLTAFGGGIAAPSANRFGRVSPTRAEHVREEFGDAVRVVLDGGESQIGLESTIVSFQGEQVCLLRPGFVTYSQMKEVVGDVIVGAAPSTPRVPGSKVSHYAPMTPMSIVPVDEIDKRAETLSEGGRRVAVLAMRLPLKTYPSVTWINAGRRPDAYAHDLYANLRALDKSGCEQILVQDVPSEEKWTAIRDRLSRGAAVGNTGSGEHDQFAETGGYSVLP